MVCVGDEVEDRLVVAHDKVNGWWELWSSMRRDELGGHGTFGAHEVGGLLWTWASLFKDFLPLQGNFKSTKLITQY
jgi:hypothetical protein